MILDKVNNIDKKILFILFDNTNFIDFPLGGTLSFDSQIIKTYKNNVALVGYVGVSDPVGRWFIKNINGVEYYFFGIGYVDKLKKNKFPLRLVSYFN